MVSPGNPGGPPGYVLSWERAADRIPFPGGAPPGWGREYDPNQYHRATPAAALEPQVRPAVAPGEPVRSGTHSVRFQLYKGDKRVNCGVRSELSGNLEPARVNPTTPTERWYGFSIFLPYTWAPDPGAESVTQWHQDDKSPGGSPPLAILTEKPMNDTVNHWYIAQRKWNINDVTKYDAGPCALRQWTDWVVHVKWSADNDGRLEIWKNGAPVPPFISKKGRNTFSNNTLHYIKIGIYKWLWNIDASGDIPQGQICSSNQNTSTQVRRVMYHDELRIVDGNGSMATVAPPGNRPPPVP
jgi:hypothetical protein